MSQQFASRPLVIAPSILASDFAKLGEAYGARGVKLRSSDDLAEAVGEAVERGGVTLVECPLEGEFLEVPPPWL